MPKRHKVRHLRRKCIGCGSCVLSAPQNWQMNSEDGLSMLIDSKETTSGEFYGTIDSDDLQQNIEAAENCPVNIIDVL